MLANFKVNQQPPTPLTRRQNSLEDVLSFAIYSPQPTAKELADAELLYHEIIRGCKEDGLVIVPPGYRGSNPPIPASGGIHNDEEYDVLDGKVSVHKLFESLWVYCPTRAGQQNIIRMVLVALFAAEHNINDYSSRSLTTIIPVAREYLSYTPTQRRSLNDTLKILAEELLSSLFLPLKAQGHCTPAVTSMITPTSRSEVESTQGTKDRLRNLRSLVLARDGSACVVSGIQDRREMQREIQRGRRRKDNTRQVGMKTETAHIIPHALNTMDSTGSLSEEKHTVWRVMNMFDPGISKDLEGPLIDTPGNAILLLADLHERFGALEAYFEEIPGESNTYKFVVVDAYVGLPEWLPLKDQVVFYNQEPPGAPQSQLPSPRLLRLHRACALILAMSGAAEYVECLLDDAEELMQNGVLAQDGSSDLTSFLRMRGLCEDMNSKVIIQHTVVTAR